MGLDDSRHLHGECKLPDGKRVVVDAITRRGVLCAVQVGGDFSPQPGTALDAVNAALLAMPLNAGEEHLAGAVREALDPDAALFGVSPEAVATAAWRALQQRSGV